MNTATLGATPSSASSGTSLRDDASVIGLVGLAHASSHFSQLLLPVMFPVFIQQFGLGFAQCGLLMTVFFVISGFGQAASGFLVDRFGARPIMFASLVLIGLACLVGAAATGYPMLMLMAALAGLGNCSFHPVDFTIMNQRISQPRLGYAFSVHGITGNLGWAAAPVFLLSFSALASWRVAYVAAAVLYGAILLLLVLHRDKIATPVAARPAGAAAQAAGGGAMEGDLSFMRLPVVWWCFFFFFFSTMTGAVVQSFSVSLLKVMHGVGFEAANATLTAYMLCGAAGMLAGGFVAARMPTSDRVVAVCMTAGAACMVVVGTGVLGAIGTMVVLAGTGFAVGIGGPSRDLMIKKATPKGATGRVYGLVYSGMDAGISLAPLVFGLFMDHGWYRATFYGAAAALLVSVVAALGVGGRTREAAIAR